MSDRAIDPKSCKILFAHNHLLSQDYCCLNSACPAILRIHKGSHPYFAARPSHPHIEHCPYANTSQSVQYKLPDDFSIEQFVFDLEHRQSSFAAAKSHTHEDLHCHLKQLVMAPRTIKQLYEFAKQNPDFHLQYCIDANTSENDLVFLQKAGTKGCKIVHGWIRQYDRQQNWFLLSVGHSFDKQKPTICLLWMPPDNFRLAFQKISSVSEHITGGSILLCGKFSNQSIFVPHYNDSTRANFVMTQCRVTSLSQVHIYKEK